MKLFRKKKNAVPDCEHCELVRRWEDRYKAARMAHDAQLGRVIRRDTEIINGLLREIDALYLLLEKERNHGNDEREQDEQYIYNCQDMKP